ncbi:hypothetical protein Trydic_g8577 [Trypoxylus dichotomus]
MGKKTRKTRWRTLPIADESDSEESNALSGSHHSSSKSYHHRPFYSKFSYSSQSTPTRRFPYEPKSTRSSSTASENKITFNEDEYTKITTPRQDVLFKKGYLRKPKNYQTQTSTGNSTASTGNSTGNGTPDHQSADGTEGTDLEYESQFVFPNGFVDQNGIYYINSYEHYPLVVYNPPMCYPEYPLSRTKRHSTGSLTESTSPHTEETSQDLSQSGGENTGNGPEFNHVYNVIYPGYYYNGVCSPNVTTNGQAATDPRKIKKKRRRKISKTVNQDETTSSEDGYSSDEAITQVENRIQLPKKTLHCDGADQSSITDVDPKKLNDVVSNAQNTEVEGESVQVENENGELQKRLEESPEESPTRNDSAMEKPESSLTEDETPTNQIKSIVDQPSESQNLPDNKQTPTQENIDANQTQTNSNQTKHAIKFNLNAEEFVPRAYRPMEPIPIDPNLQFINMHPNFVPLPLINHHLNELPGSPFNAPFLPPGIPLNFMPADPKMIPNFVNFTPNHFVQHPKSLEENRSVQGKAEESKDRGSTSEKPNEETNVIETQKDVDEVEEKQENEVKEPEKIENLEKAKSSSYKTEVDIAKIVSKLEEAAKEQKLSENRRPNYRSPSKFTKTPRQRFNSPYQNEFKQENYKRPKSKRFNEHTDGKPVEEILTNQTTENQTTQTKVEEISQSDLQNKTETKNTLLTTKNQEEDRRYPSPRHQNYKNSPRKYINNYSNRNGKNSRVTQENHQQISYSAPNMENYSDTLKKSPNYSKSCPRFQKYASNRTNITTPPNRVPLPTKLDETTKELNKIAIAQRTSQWIAVSSKKKRKSRSSTEDDIENTNEDSDLSQKIEGSIVEIYEQEKFEVNEVPPTIPPMEPKIEDVESSTKIENIIEVICKSEATSQTSTNDIPMAQIQLKDVKEIEKEMLRNTVEKNDITTSDDVPQTKLNESPQNPSHLKNLNIKDIQKKKSKKGNNKNTTKRIMIIDPDVSKEETQITKSKEIPKPKGTKAPQELEITVPKTSKDIPKIEEVNDKTVQKEGSPDSVVLTLPEEPMESLTTPDKKKSKKKKKQTKSTLSSSIPSISSSTTTLNNMDDSYDFLLDTTALVDDKTNVEVSEELDKMIQKGLFEKFKSLNVSVGDDFFKSLSLKPKNQSTPEKGFIKATNFTTILNNANTSLSKKYPLDGSDKIDIDFSKVKLPDYESQPSTSRSGNFLGSVIESETGPPSMEINDRPVSGSKSNGKLKNKSKKNSLICESEMANKVASKDDEEIQLKNECLSENVECNKEECNSGNEDLIIKNEETGSSLDVNENGVEEDGFFHKEIELTYNDFVVKNQDEIRSDFDNFDNKLDHKEIIIQNDAGASKIDVPKPINGYVLQHNNAKIEISLETNASDTLNSTFDNNFLENDLDSFKKTLEDEQIIIEIEENIVQNENESDQEDQEATKQNHVPDIKSHRDSFEMKPLYPITSAVKEWMTKTRETTPEIEILKSPETIYKELIEDTSEDDSDSETCQKNANGNPSPVYYLDDQPICHYSSGDRVAKMRIPNVEDDSTICETWSMSENTSLQDEDLLDCWEPDVVETSKKEESIEEGEDVLELIEKNYGKDDKNDDFQRLKTEVEERKRNGAFPRHADLPYRAICCSLM